MIDAFGHAIVEIKCGKAKEGEEVRLNSKLLRPGLQNPHMASALQELCDQEQKRALDVTSSNKEHMKKILRAIQTQSSF